jgi:DNA-binding MarR family transcriptional regulator
MSTVSQRPLKSHSLRLESRRPGEVIAYLLKSLHHSLRQAVDEAFRVRRIEMSFAHLATLYTLQAEPGVAGAELARRGFVTAQTMNTILRRLEKDGDIERRPHPASMRADSWFITKAGEQRLERAKVVGDEVWRRMLSALKAGEVEQLQGLLKRCIVGLDVQVEDMRAKKAGKGATKKRVARK